MGGYDEFCGKTVLVTGSGSGMGRETALRFAACGAAVHGADLNAAANRETARLVAETGGAMHAAEVDMGNPEAVSAWVRACAGERDAIDVLVNNASAAKFGKMPDLSVADWHFTLRNELDSVFLPTLAAWPFLTAASGVIVNIASVAGHRASNAAGNTAHAATKGAVLAMTRQWAKEGAAHGVRAVSLSPGFIKTPGTAFISDNPAIEAALNKSIPLGRAGQPADIAAVVLFVASGGAAYLTGTDIIIDGGMTA